MASQDQKVSGTSVALQSEGDITINVGADKAELSALITDMGKRLIELHGVGQAKVEARLDRFEKEVLKRFDSGSADPKAFEEPDFQYALHNAQKNYVRSDDDIISESLVNLLSERSRYSGRSRASLCLNASIEIVGNLTSEEIAVMTVIFITRRTVVNPGTEDQIIDHLKRHAAPLLPELPKNKASIEYLASLGCLSLIPLSQVGFWQAIQISYGAALTPAFTEREIQSRVAGFGPEHRSLLRIDNTPTFLPAAIRANVLNEAPTGKDASENLLLRFGEPGKEHIKLELERIGAQNLENDINKMIDEGSGDLQKIIDNFTTKEPLFKEIETAWNILNFGSYNPTALGITVGHSNARRLWTSFNAPLSIWVN